MDMTKCRSRLTGCMSSFQEWIFTTKRALGHFKVSIMHTRVFAFQGVKFEGFPCFDYNFFKTTLKDNNKVYIN